MFLARVCLFDRAIQPIAFRLKRSQPRAGAADIAYKNHGSILLHWRLSDASKKSDSAGPHDARSIIRKFPWRQRPPDVQHRIDDAPSGFDHVRALKQSCVSDHAVVKQYFVPGIRICSEILRVFKAHVDGAHAQKWSGNLRSEIQA